MEISMWYAVAAAHQLMSIIVDERLTEPKDVRAKMHETYAFHDLSIDDRNEVIELAWYLSCSPLDGVFEVLGQGPGISDRDRILGEVVGQRRALEKVLRECASLDQDQDHHPYDLSSDLREMLLRLSNVESGSCDHDQTQASEAARLSAREEKRLNGDQLENFSCAPAVYPHSSEPIEAVLLSQSLDRTFFKANPDRRFLVRRAYWVHLHPDQSFTGWFHFVVAHRLSDGCVKTRLFRNNGDHLPPDTDTAAEVLWNIPPGSKSCRPFFKAVQEAAREPTEAEAQWIQSGRKPQQ